MTGVPISGNFDVIVRRSSLERLSLSESFLARLLETEGSLAGDKHLIVVGPSFGDDAADEFRSRLRRAGLVDVDDFLILSVDLPDWAALRIEHVEP